MPHTLDPQNTAAWIGANLRTVAGRSVSYSRGVASVAVTGIGVAQRHTLVGQDNLTTNVRIYEWTFKASDLVLSGEQITPRNGDVIRETLLGNAVTYQVLDLDDDTPCYEWLDGSGIELKIHTKRVR